MKVRSSISTAMSSGSARRCDEQTQAARTCRCRVAVRLGQVAPIPDVVGIVIPVDIFTSPAELVVKAVRAIGFSLKCPQRDVLVPTPSKASKRMPTRAAAALLLGLGTPDAHTTA